MKKITKIFAAALAAVTMLSATACGSASSTGVKIDPNKTQIYVYARNQGLGFEFLTELANRFNAKPENSEYQVIAQWGDDELTSTVSSKLDAGNCNYNIYFGGQSDLMAMIEEDKLMDLTDVYAMKVDDDDQTIAQKTPQYDEYARIFTKLDGSGGIYAMPFTTSPAAGLVFDYQTFLDAGYLDYAKTSELNAVNTQAGETVVTVSNGKLKVTKAFGNYDVDDFVLSTGKDGKYGTYDDGQKTTLAEFYELIRTIVNDQETPLIYTTKYAGGYTKSVFTSYMAQIMGVDNFKVFTSFDGEIKGKDGATQATLTMENGNTAWDTDAVTNAYMGSLDFFNNIVLGKLTATEGGSDVIGPDTMLHQSTYRNGPTSSLTHLEAQKQFAMGNYYGSDGAMFLVEGCWWEKEAKTSLERLDGYGGREHRTYLLPATENQITPQDQTVLYTDELSAVMVFNNYPKKLKTAEAKQEFMAKVKEFLAYTCSDEACVWYTQHQGLMRSFDYEIPADVMAGLTPYQRNTIELLNDTEHIKFAIAQAGPENLMRSYYNGIDNTTSRKANGTGYVVPYTALSGKAPEMTPAGYYEGIKRVINNGYAGQLAVVKQFLSTLQK